MRREHATGRLGLVLLVALALLAWLPGAEAGKGGNKPGGGGGGGGGTPPGGTVYFTSQGLTWTMDAGGGSKTALPSNVFGEPSYGLHGGHRWWLQARTTTDGWQLFAVRGDGDESATVRLTTDPALEVWDRRTNNVMAPTIFRWSKDDTAVSWVGLRWSGSTAIEPGIYTAAILFNTAGGVTGLLAQPVAPTIELDFLAGDPQVSLAPDGGSHDWSPDGSHMAYGLEYIANVRPYEILVCNLLTGQSTLLATQAAGPRWAPDGTRIAFGRTGAGDLYTIRPDGTGETLLAASRGGGKRPLSLSTPRWAPTSAHLVYHRGIMELGYQDESDVWRITDTAKDATNLTDDLSVGAQPVAWR